MLLQKYIAPAVRSIVKKAMGKTHTQKFNVYALGGLSLRL